MASSGYVWNGRMDKFMARPHDEKRKAEKNNRATVEHVTRFGSAGELRTTPSDYARFLIEVINPEPADPFRLTGETRNEMVRPHVDVPGYPFRSSWALGWQILHLEEGDVICHGGDNEGFHSMAAASVATKSGFVVMTNGERGVEMIWRRLLKDLLTNFVLV
jgi:CubicO group peptidase (beta-lactamase class C family)